jgi:hypothetical protein
MCGERVVGHHVDAGGRLERIRFAIQTFPQSARDTRGIIWHRCKTYNKTGGSFQLTDIQGTVATSLASSSLKI